MWSRYNYSMLNNSGGFIFQITFRPCDTSIHDEISLEFYRVGRPTLILSVQLSNSASSFEFDLDNAEVEKEIVKTFSQINGVVGCSLPADAFHAAVSDILNKVMPAERSVPWGRPRKFFDREVEILNDQLRSQMTGKTCGL